MGNMLCTCTSRKYKYLPLGRGKRPRDRIGYDNRDSDDEFDCTVDVDISAGDDAIVLEDTASEICEEEWDTGRDPEPYSRNHLRRKAVSVEAWGPANPQPTYYKIPAEPKSPRVAQSLRKALKSCPLFSTLSERAYHEIVAAMPIREVAEGSCIFEVGAPGDEAFVIIDGEVSCYVGDSAESKPNSATEQVKDPRQLVRVLGPGRVFGDLSMMWQGPRSLTTYSTKKCILGSLTRSLYLNLIVRGEMELYGLIQSWLRKSAMFEALNDEQIAKLADVLELCTYEKDVDIITQGDVGSEFFCVLEGECVALVETGLLFNLDVQEHRRYGPGGMFGENGLVTNAVRGATVRVTSDYAQVLQIKRGSFERLLGSVKQLRDQSYLTDPRMSIAEFYGPGDERGPRGSLKLNTLIKSAPVNNGLHRKVTKWFAVYRPTSRDAIAKMIAGTAVGKGLNVKGKSAKRNHLSGLVPFLQIHDDDHKKYLEEPNAKGRVEIYYASEPSRAAALTEMRALLRDNAGLKIEGDQSCLITQLDNYAKSDGCYGLEVPEPVVFELYIKRPSLQTGLGWETGRPSEPAFMNWNCHSLHSKEPHVVLYQSDLSNPMNPRGLLIAYAEEHVKPVVSDFDTFCVGSKGMTYAEPLPDKQVEYLKRSLARTEMILEDASRGSWTSSWIKLQPPDELEQMSIPKYGFGDPTSYRLICEVVEMTKSTGAVRHGAECFNFFFPQDLDESYLVVWDGFIESGSGLPWAYKGEEELRDFLVDRVAEGFRFPLNPTWVARDPGWYDVWSALMESAPEMDGSHPNDAWYPPDSGIRDQIERLHKTFPQGMYTPSFTAEELEEQRKREEEEFNNNGLVQALAFLFSGKLVQGHSGEENLAEAQQIARRMHPEAWQEDNVLVDESAATPSS